MVDVSQHELVPDHTVLDGEDIETVMEEYNIKKTDLPKIKRKDKKPMLSRRALAALDAWLGSDPARVAAE